MIKNKKMNKIIKNCMPEKEGKCTKCGAVGFVSNSKGYWHEGYCYDCTMNADD